MDRPTCQPIKTRTPDSVDRVTDHGPRPLDPPSGIGRTFTRSRRVRLADADPAGRLRLDSLLRYTQDVSDDDTTDAGLGDEAAWVARRTVIDELRPAEMGESLEVTTFCGGLGRRWAERRLRLVGEGAHYEVSTLWICLDPDSGRPIPLTRRFLEIYADAAAGRTVRARLTLPGPDDADSGPAPGAAGPAGCGGDQPWPLRLVDLDIYEHVNNAAYAAALEELRAGWDVTGPCRWTLEYRAGIDPGARVTLRWRRRGATTLVWWLVDPEGDAEPGPGRGSGGPEVAATASLEPVSAGLYRS